MGLEFERDWNNMTLDEIDELCKNPSKYGLKWGEYVMIIDMLLRSTEAVNRINNPKAGTSADTEAKLVKLEKEIGQLRLRMSELEKKLSRFAKAFVEEDEDDD